VRLVCSLVCVLLIASGAAGRTRAAAAAQSVQASAAGFVVDVKGRWELARPGAAPMPLTRKTVVNAGDTLRRGDDDPASYVIVALYTGVVEKYVVTRTVPARAESTVFGRIVRAIQQRFEEGFVTASVRGGGDLPDAVVEATPDRMDVSAVLRGLGAGTYTVTAYPVLNGRASSSARAAERVNAAATGAVAIAPLPPGVYQLDVSGSNPAEGGRAWIAVVAPDRYADAARAFVTRPGANVSGDADMRAAARAMARAYLIVLDAEARATR